MQDITLRPDVAQDDGKQKMERKEPESMKEARSENIVKSTGQALSSKSGLVAKGKPTPKSSVATISALLDSTSSVKLNDIGTKATVSQLARSHGNALSVGLTVESQAEERKDETQPSTGNEVRDLIVKVCT